MPALFAQTSCSPPRWFLEEVALVELEIAPGETEDIRHVTLWLSTGGCSPQCTALWQLELFGHAGSRAIWRIPDEAASERERLFTVGRHAAGAISVEECADEPCVSSFSLELAGAPGERAEVEVAIVLAGAAPRYGAPPPEGVSARLWVE
ncbi:MAG: hypothetical protein KF729_25865 [Sandaracinaceae bacterium]|nr:hypothetical protein [Sandaracinaceae bacterium]